MHGFPTIHHNELRDFIAVVSSEVCHDVRVAIEPPLQPFTGETLSYATANVEDGARLDVSAYGFGVVVIREPFLMQRSSSSILVLPAIRALKFPRCIASLNGRSAENMNSVFGRWKCARLFH